MKKTTLRLLNFILLPVFAAVLGAVLLTAVYMLPAGKIHLHVSESVETLEREGDYPTVPGIFETRTQLDNLTDCLMLYKALYRGKGTPLSDAMNIPSYYVKGTDREVDLLKMNLEPAQNKKLTIMNYARYWHGYLLFLKPALLFFNYMEIRGLLAIFQLSLLTVTALLLYRRCGAAGLLPLLGAVLVINSFAAALSLQYTCTYVIALLGAASIAWLGGRTRWMPYIFLCIGVLEAFFDLLTYPLVSLGLPLGVYLMVQGRVDASDHCLHKKSSLLPGELCSMAGFSVLWVFGYGSMWALKWLTGSLILRRNVLADAMNAVAFRTGGEYANLDLGIKNAINVNMWHIKGSVLTVFLLLTLATWAVILFLRIRKHTLRIDAAGALCAAALGFFPIVRFAVLRNHSVIHNYFTYKNLAVSVLAFPLFLYRLFPGDSRP